MTINRRTILKYLGLGSLSFLIPTKELKSKESESKELAFFRPIETDYYNGSLGRLIDFQMVTESDNFDLATLKKSSSQYIRWVNFPSQTTLTLIYEQGSEAWVTYNYSRAYIAMMRTSLKRDIIEARAFTKMPQNVPCEFIPELKLHDNVFKLASITFGDNTKN